MIDTHDMCRMCGQQTEAVEVELHHATPEHRKKAGARAGSVLATAVCRTCARAVASAWAGRGGACVQAAS